MQERGSANLKDIGNIYHLYMRLLEAEQKIRDLQKAFADFVCTPLPSTDNGELVNVPR